MDDVFNKLTTLRHGSTGAKCGSTHHQGEHTSTHAKPVEVAGVVMDYIEKKRLKDLDRIQGKNVFIETPHSSPSGKTRVSFNPCHSNIKPVHTHLARERFITLYQRTASDLQMKSLTVDSNDFSVLQSRFPELVIEPNHNKNKAKVTGPFVQIHALEEFLRSTTSNSSSPRRTNSTHAARRRVSSTSPVHSKQTEEESCAICMDTITATEKKTLPCKHSFCKDCLKMAFMYKPVCPTCGVLYGTLTGTQPDGGTMDVTKHKTSLPGYEKYGTIVIHYYIPDGIQTVRTERMFALSNMFLNAAFHHCSCCSFSIFC